MPTTPTTLRPNVRIRTDSGRLATIQTINPAVPAGRDVLVLFDGAAHPCWIEVRPDQVVPATD